MKVNPYIFATGGYYELACTMLAPRCPASLRDSLVIICPRDDNGLIAPINLAGATDNSDYHDLMLFRLEMYLTYIRQHRDEIVVFLDCDTLIFKDFSADLNERLKDHDLLHQNGSFIALKVSDRMVKFWEELIEYCRDAPRGPGFPEFQFHEFLALTSLKWSRLPKEYGYLCPQAYTYHALNGGTSIFEKALVLGYIWYIYEDIQKEKNDENLFWKHLLKAGYNDAFWDNYHTLEIQGGCILTDSLSFPVMVPFVGPQEDVFSPGPWSGIDIPHVRLIDVKALTASGDTPWRTHDGRPLVATALSVLLRASWQPATEAYAYNVADGSFEVVYTETSGTLSPTALAELDAAGIAIAPRDITRNKK